VTKTCRGTARDNGREERKRETEREKESEREREKMVREKERREKESENIHIYIFFPPDFPPKNGVTPKLPSEVARCL